MWVEEFCYWWGCEWQRLSLATHMEGLISLYGRCAQDGLIGWTVKRDASAVAASVIWLPVEGSALQAKACCLYKHSQAISSSIQYLHTLLPLSVLGQLHRPEFQWSWFIHVLYILINGRSPYQNHSRWLIKSVWYKQTLMNSVQE